MDDRKIEMKKKIEFCKVKRKLEQFECFQIIDIIETEKDEIKNYRDQITEMNRYSYPEVAIKKIDKNVNIMITWFFENISIIKNNAIWVIPFDTNGIWWVKVKVTECRKAIAQLWDMGEICLIDQETKKCFYIQVDEDNCLIKFKQLQ